MKKVDYIVVGFGLAGLCLTEEFLQKGHTVLVIDTAKGSSLVAAGMYNPVILKRFTPVWKAKEQLEEMHCFFGRIEKKFNKKYLSPISVKRIFANEQEIETWKKKQNNKDLKGFLGQVKQDENTAINTPYQIGLVKQAGRLAIKPILKDYIVYLKKKEAYLLTSFDYADLVFQKKELVIYKNWQAKKIIFCEGFGLKNNPYFKHLPLVGSKGEVLHVKLEKAIEGIYKSKVFVIPIEEDRYYVGATYNREDKEITPTKEALKMLMKGLHSFYTEKVKVINHLAGIRPTVKDRRPLLGIHDKYPQLAILNGLGTRGVLLAPSMAKALYLHLEEGRPLDPEVDIDRFS